MAIAHRASSGFNAQVNTFSVTIPAAQLTGDMMIFMVAGKPFNVDDGWTGPSGWTFLGSADNGSTAAGVDTGSMIVAAWWKEATSDTETNPTLTEGTPNFNVVAGQIMVFSKGAGEVWVTPTFNTGGDTTSGTGFSATMNADPGVTTGDHCISFAGFQTDAATPCSSHIVATQTGITFTNTHDPATDLTSTTGGDMGMCLNRATVSGTSSAAPVVGATLAAAATGTAGFIRLRVSSSQPVTPGLISQTAATFSPTITPGQVTVAPSLISQLAATFSPTLTQVQSVVAGLINNTAATFAPTLSVGSVTVSPGLISQVASTFSPTVLQPQILSTGLISQLAATFSPSIVPGSVTVAPPLISQLAAVFAVQLSQDATPAGGGALDWLKAARIRRR